MEETAADKITSKESARINDEVMVETTTTVMIMMMMMMMMMIIIICFEAKKCARECSGRLL